MAAHTHVRSADSGVRITTARRERGSCNRARWNDLHGESRALRRAGGICRGGASGLVAAVADIAAEFSPGWLRSSVADCGWDHYAEQLCIGYDAGCGSDDQCIWFGTAD